MPNNADELYMRRALELARRGWGATSPNPMVGAVLVKNGAVIGEGWHKRDGMPHAEIECLKNASETPKGAAIYVTLEPCSTRGRTGACTEALVSAGVSAVKIGALDPNPAHSGRAVEIFRKAGIKCETGILERECSELNFIFNFSIVKKSPLVALKYAMSSDGKLTSERGKRTRITGSKAAADTMKWRRLFSSIGVGRGTLEIDDPSLTSRMEGEEESCAPRLVFDARLGVAGLENFQKFKVFSDKFRSLTRVVCQKDAPSEREKSLKSAGITVMKIGAAAGSAEFWRELKERLYSERITSLYIEGGAGLMKSVCDARAADFAFEYRSPSAAGPRGLDAFESGKRPFEIDGRTVKLGADSLEFGTVKWTR